MEHKKAIVATLLYAGAVALSAWLSVTAIIALVNAVSELL